MSPGSIGAFLSLVSAIVIIGAGVFAPLTLVITWPFLLVSIYLAVKLNHAVRHPLGRTVRRDLRVSGVLIMVMCTLVSIGLLFSASLGHLDCSTACSTSVHEWDYYSKLIAIALLVCGTALGLALFFKRP